LAPPSFPTRRSSDLLAESCTGGYVAKLLTDVAGSSRWFDSGFVTYSNAAKQRQLGVDPGTLEKHGAVSERTAIEMAVGALAVSRSEEHTSELQSREN